MELSTNECGFYDSLKGDRKYSASNIAEMFDGLIYDGVFATVGNEFVVTAAGGLYLTIGSGKAWFNRTWTYTKQAKSLQIPTNQIPTFPNYSRIATVYLEVNKKPTARVNSFNVAYGDIFADNDTPIYAKLTNSDDEAVYQHPLAHVRLKANASAISQTDITNCVGTSECPLVTGIIKTVNIDNLLRQWDSEFEDWKNANTEEYRQFYADLTAILEPGTEAGTVALMKQEWMQFKSENSRYHDSQVIEFGNNAEGAGSWSYEAPYKQTVTITDMKPEDTPIIEAYIPDDLQLGAEEDYMEEAGFITKFETGTDSITAYCYSDRPTKKLSFLVKGR